MNQPVQPDLITATARGGLVEGGRQLAYRLHLPTTLLKFVIVGGFGFLINQFCLFLAYDTPLLGFLPDKDTHTDLLLLTHKDIRLLLASIMAVEVAIVCQFNFHERWTFRKRNRGGIFLTRFLKFNAASAVAVLVSITTVNLLTPVIRDAAGDDSLIGTVAPYLSVAVGTVLGFAWNFTLNHFVIWPRQREAAENAEA